MDKVQFLWKDRKRILGMPITFTKYAISDDRLFLEVGLFNMKQDETLLYRIRDITLNITLWQRIFKVGSVTVLSSDQTTPKLVLKNIKHPRDTKELLHQQVESAKLARKLRLGELLDSGEITQDEAPEE